jgi:hypothetical protein
LLDPGRRLHPLRPFLFSALWSVAQALFLGM